MSWTQPAKYSVEPRVLRIFGVFCQHRGRYWGALQAFLAYGKCLNWPTVAFCRCGLGCKGDFDSASQGARQVPAGLAQSLTLAISAAKPTKAPPVSRLNAFSTLARCR